MKKRAVKVLLPLLFSCFCVFSGFLNVNAYAAYSTYPQYDMTIPSSFVLSSNTEGTAWYQHTLNRGDDSNYHLAPNSQGWVNNTSVYIATYLQNSTETDDKFYFPVNTDLFDYYLVATLGTDDIANKISITDFDIGNIVGASAPNLSFESSNLLSDKKMYYSSYTGGYTNSYGVQSIACTAKLNIDYVGDMNLGMFAFYNANGFVYSSTKFFSLSVIVSNKGDSDAYNEIIAAINDQTTSLGGKLDSIDQSIEDQYSGDPEKEFSVDDVITQHNEKMGVLSFGSDVMLQFLDLFQSANVGTAQLTLPGFNITVENVEYSVWPDYSFNFEQLNEWVPGLMSVIRLMLPAFVWLMVLRYCINVFEKNFLSNGG